MYAYPTAAQEHAPATITDHFATRDETDAVLLVCSCSTRQATPDSCLDMQVIVPTEVVARVETLLKQAAEGDPSLAGLSASFGCAGCPEDATDPQTLFRLADEAQYDAKRNGSVLRFVARA